MRNFPKALIFFFLFAISFTLSSMQQGFSQSETEIGIVEKLDSYLSDDLVFYNDNQEKVNLKSLIDKPTVLSFVYFDCPGMCSPLLNGVSEVIEKSELELGKDYQVITISFNYNDTPEKAKEKKKNFVLNISKDKAKSWIYLTGDTVNIKKVTGEVGFKFKPTGLDFAHPSAIIILSPEAKVTRYLYGIYYLPFDFKMAISEASHGISRPTITKVLEFCFSYDPVGKRYALDVMKISASIIIFFAVLIFLILVFKKKKRN